MEEHLIKYAKKKMRILCHIIIDKLIFFFSKDLTFLFIKTFFIHKNIAYYSFSQLEFKIHK